MDSVDPYVVVAIESVRKSMEQPDIQGAFTEDSGQL